MNERFIVSDRQIHLYMYCSKCCWYIHIGIVPLTFMYVSAQLWELCVRHVGLVVRHYHKQRAKVKQTKGYYINCDGSCLKAMMTEWYTTALCFATDKHFTRAIRVEEKSNNQCGWWHIHYTNTHTHTELWRGCVPQPTKYVTYTIS